MNKKHNIKRADDDGRMRKREQHLFNISKELQETMIHFQRDFFKKIATLYTFISIVFLFASLSSLSSYHHMYFHPLLESSKVFTSTTLLFSTYSSKLSVKWGKIWYLAKMLLWKKRYQIQSLHNNDYIHDVETLWLTCWNKMTKDDDLCHRIIKFLVLFHFLFEIDSFNLTHCYCCVMWKYHGIKIMPCEIFEMDLWRRHGI